MDREIYLILVGAGISLISSVVTLLLQFFLGLYSDRIKRSRDETERRSAEIRNQLLSRETINARPRKSTYGSGMGKPASPPWFLKQLKFIYHVILDNKLEFLISLVAGVSVFIGWILFVILN